MAVCALAFAFAYPMQVNGYNQTAHYALVRSLASGTPNIDRSRGEIGELSTGDAALYKGHWYATRPPGLAAATVPAFFLLEAIGMRTTGDPTRVIWALHLWSIVLPALALVLLVAWAAGRIEPGFGTAAAVGLGLGTLVLSFGTLFFSHVPAAALGFAAFALLWRERESAPRPALVAAAGVLAGLAVTVEYPLVFVAVILGLYVLASPGRRVGRLLAYGGGGLVGVAPLLAFNQWAFGSPVHIAHEDYFESAEHGSAGVLQVLALPGAGKAGDLLFSSMGLVILSPVLAAGLVAALALARRRERRPEALVILAVAAVYLLFNASLSMGSLFGGLGPPRYLVTILPFLAVPLAIAFRHFPLTTSALALVSVFQTVVMTATGPLAAYDGAWLERVASRTFVETGASIVGITGWYAIVPFLGSALVALVAALLASPPVAASARDGIAAIVALLGWALRALTATNPNGQPPGTGYVVMLTLAVAGAVVVAALLGRRGVLAIRTPGGGDARG